MLNCCCFSYVNQLQRNTDHQGNQLGQMETQSVSYSLYFQVKCTISLLQIATGRCNNQLELLLFLTFNLHACYCMYTVGTPAIKKEEHGRGQGGFSKGKITICLPNFTTKL
jgi:hypothetical protein